MRRSEGGETEAISTDESNYCNLNFQVNVLIHELVKSGMVLSYANRKAVPVW